MKAARRVDAKENKPKGARQDGVDPDIADIVPGPQPHPFLEDDELDEAAEEKQS